MQIKIHPEKLLKMCLWDSYTYYILSSEKEAERILKENMEIDLSERDALIIGLLKIIETHNLIHKFNTHLTEILTNKSIRESDLTLIRKKTFDSSVDKFLDKFPDYWEPNTTWANSLKDLVEYVDALRESVSKIDIIEITNNNVTYEFYNSNVIKKFLKFNY